MYLVGDLSGKTFTPAEFFFTTAAPTEEDGYTYVLMGILTSATYMILYPGHPMYRNVAGEFKPLSCMGYESYTEVETLTIETQIAIEQTNAAIALKADQTTVSDLSFCVESAEQQITPQAITSWVLASAWYAFEKTNGRNYCLNSTAEHKFVDGYYRYASGATSTVTGQRLEVSEDFYAHSNGLSRMLFFFDIKRTGINASTSATAGTYGGFWIYYTYCGGDDGTRCTPRDVAST